MTTANEISSVLASVCAGDSAARERLWNLLYTELRQMAAGQVAREKPGQGIQATTLVHEAYFRLFGDTTARDDAQARGSEARSPSSDGAGQRPVPRGPLPHFENRRHFFAAAAQAMRRIIIDDARIRRRVNRGGGWVRTPLNDLPDSAVADANDLLSIDEALERLAADSPRAAEVVNLRYFAGLSGDEAAEVLRVSPRSVDTDWRYAKPFLFRELTR